MTAPVYRFGNAELRPATRTLRVDGQEAAIGARAFDLLLVLVENRDRMLTKSELLDLVWPNLVVEENNLQVQVSTLRKLLGAKAISTIPGRGYRFVAPLADQAPAPPAPPPPAPPPAVQQALPALREQLVGRDAERALLVELLRSQRLVTVVGAGGIGKTSLALAAARELGWMFRERVCVAELAAVPSGEHLVDAVARALRIQLPAGAADPASVLAERLGDAPQLLVLDNCEHLTEAAATLARVLLDKAPQLHLMATSQEPLRLATEQLVRLPPLGVPAAGERGDPARHAALDLLQRRVQAQRPAFRLDESNLDDATAIVQQLDGLPLAVELAAARVPLLGMAGVRQNLDERLRLLASSARDLPSRHRTLRAMLDWSHALLSDDERTVFR
ncbi:MAG: winged helix-turn-helix domain-containing protein, partial [Rubrivivax sp.]|nr:winged helix-turn-helix domain-containing protein [Rubrivivax sp.]